MKLVKKILPLLFATFMSNYSMDVGDLGGRSYFPSEVSWAAEWVDSFYRFGRARAENVDYLHYSEGRVGCGCLYVKSVCSLFSDNELSKIQVCFEILQNNENLSGLAHGLSTLLDDDFKLIDMLQEDFFEENLDE